jgi:hypothetical protein
MNLLLQSLKDTLEQVRSRHRRRIPFLGPPLERRRPRILPEAAARYHQLLTYELDGLRELVAVLPSTTAGRDLQECLTESLSEIERLEIEVDWCAGFLRP